MFRLIAFALALILAVAAPSAAQMTLLGAGGFKTAGLGGGGYSGPVDVNGTAYAFWSTRCGSTAYTGNVMDVWDAATGSTTETLVTCSSGGVINQTINTLATTCASSCKVKTLYNQAGTANVGDMTNATNATRPTLTLSCKNSLPCLTYSGTESLSATATTGIASNATFTMTAVAKGTNSTTTPNSIFVDSTSTVTQFSFNNFVADNVFIYAGAGTVNATATHNVIHTLQGLVQATPAVSQIMVDGGTAATSSITDNGIPNGDVVVLGNGGNPLTGTIFEFGIWAGDKSALFGTMNTNQTAFWALP